MVEMPSLIGVDSIVQPLIIGSLLVGLDAFHGKVRYSAVGVLVHSLERRGGILPSVLCIRPILFLGFERSQSTLVSNPLCCLATVALWLW